MTVSISERVLANTVLGSYVDSFKSDVKTTIGTNLQRKIDQAGVTLDDIFLYGKGKNDNEVKATAYKRLVRSYVDLTICKFAKEAIDSGPYGAFKKFILNSFGFKTAVEHAEDKLNELESVAVSLLKPEKKGAFANNVIAGAADVIFGAAKLQSEKTGTCANDVITEEATSQAEKTDKDVTYSVLTGETIERLIVNPSGIVTVFCEETPFATEPDRDGRRSLESGRPCVSIAPSGNVEALSADSQDAHPEHIEDEQFPLFQSDSHELAVEQVNQAPMNAPDGVSTPSVEVPSEITEDRMRIARQRGVVESRFKTLEDRVTLLETYVPKVKEMQASLEAYEISSLEIKPCYDFLSPQFLVELQEVKKKVALCEKNISEIKVYVENFRSYYNELGPLYDAIVTNAYEEMAVGEQERTFQQFDLVYSQAAEEFFAAVRAEPAASYSLNEVEEEMKSLRTHWNKMFQRKDSIASEPSYQMENYLEEFE